MRIITANHQNHSWFPIRKRIPIKHKHYPWITWKVFMLYCMAVSCLQPCLVWLSPVWTVTKNPGEPRYLTNWVHQILTIAFHSCIRQISQLDTNAFILIFRWSHLTGSIQERVFGWNGIHSEMRKWCQSDSWSAQRNSVATWVLQDTTGKQSNGQSLGHVRRKENTCFELQNRNKTSKVSYPTWIY